MAKWIPCEDGFIEADVIRWKEGVWERRGRLGRRITKRTRAINVGDRVVTGEVLKDDGDGWVRVLVRKCEIVSEKPGRRVALLPKGEEVRRRRRTIERGEPERLLWSDETARGALISQFLGKR